MYNEMYNTYMFPVEGDISKMSTWRSAITDALREMGIDMSMHIALPDVEKTAEKQEEKPLKLPANIKKELEAQGVIITPELVEQFSTIMKHNIPVRKKGAALTSMVKLPDGTREPRVVMNWFGFTDHPEKKKEKKRGITCTPQVFSIRKNRTMIKDDEDPVTPILPINSAGEYILYFPSVGSDICHAKRGFGRMVKCESFYDRNPQDRKSYGTPVYMQDWLKEQSCKDCMYAPHRDKKKDKENGIGENDGCRFQRCQHCLLGGIIDGKPLLKWGDLQTGGQLDFFLQTSSLKGKRPHYHYIICLRGIKLIEEAQRKKREIEDASDFDQEPLITREDTPDMFNFVSIISGKVKDYFKLKLAPNIDKEAPGSFDSEKYEEEEKKEQEIVEDDTIGGSAPF